MHTHVVITAVKRCICKTAAFHAVPDLTRTEHDEDKQNDTTNEGKHTYILCLKQQSNNTSLQVPEDEWAATSQYERPRWLALYPMWQQSQHSMLPERHLFNSSPLKPSGTFAEFLHHLNEF